MTWGLLKITEKYFIICCWSKKIKEYYLDWNFNLKPDADKNEYFDLLNFLTFDLYQKAIARPSEEFKTLQIKDF